MSEDSPTPFSGALSRQELAAALRRVLRERLSGALVLEGAGEVQPLWARQGELYVDPRHRLVPPVEEVAGEVALPELRAGDPHLLDLIGGIVDRIPFGTGGFTFDPHHEGEPGELVGPIPAHALVAEVTVRGRSEEELLCLLGGEEAVYRTAPEVPGLRLPPLDDVARQLLSRLTDAMAVGELLRLRIGERGGVVRRLAGLAALGLVEAVADEGRRPGGSESAGEDLVGRFLDRIAADLDETPYDLEAPAHRAQVALLLGRAGGLTHYELLDVPPDASEEAVAGAYQDLARLVHPRHAERLGLGDRVAVLHLLFERATRAYLTLSDPERRRRYAADVGVETAGPGRSEAELAVVRREMARANYDRARTAVSREKFHTAIELLRDAVRWDPRADYLALLGDCEARNPNWIDEAIAHLREAVRREPAQAGFRVMLGRVLEKTGREADALVEYEQALASDPAHPDARTALERLRPPPPPGLLARLLARFGRRD